MQQIKCIIITVRSRVKTVVHNVKFAKCLLVFLSEDFVTLNITGCHRSNGLERTKRQSIGKTDSMAVKKLKLKIVP